MEYQTINFLFKPHILFWLTTNLTHSFLFISLLLSDVPVLTGTSESHPPECVIPDDVLIHFCPPDDEHLLLETCRGMK
jgi:hypothetical protein